MIHFFILLALFALPLPAEARGSAATEALAQAVKQYEKAQTIAQWIEQAPHLSSVERAALLGDRRLAKESKPDVRLRRLTGGRLELVIGTLVLDVSRLKEGKIFYEGRLVRLDRRTFVYDLAGALAHLVGPSRAKKAAWWQKLAWPEAWAAGSGSGVSHACASDIPTSVEALYNTTVGFYAPPIFGAMLGVSAVRGILRVVANCDSHVQDLRRLLRENNLAVKSLSCGSDQHGTDRRIEFWTQERDSAGAFRTRAYNLDYTYGYAHEEREEADDSGKPAPADKLYVFGHHALAEVRVLRDQGADYLGDCESLRAPASARQPESDSFRAERERIEPFRKIFYYIGINESCTSCARQLQTQLISPRAPSYFPAAAPTRAPGAAGPAPAAPTGGAGEAPVPAAADSSDGEDEEDESEGAQ